MSTDQRENIEDIRKKLSPDQLEQLSEYFRSQNLKTFLGALPITVASDLKESGSNHTVNALAHQIGKAYAMKPRDVLLNALGLIALALDAKSHGNRIAILGPDDEILQEIVGFDSADVAAQPAGK